MSLIVIIVLLFPSNAHVMPVSPENNHRNRMFYSSRRSRRLSFCPNYDKYTPNDGPCLCTQGGAQGQIECKACQRLPLAYHSNSITVSRVELIIGSKSTVKNGSDRICFDDLAPNNGTEVTIHVTYQYDKAEACSGCVTQIYIGIPALDQGSCRNNIATAEYTDSFSLIATGGSLHFAIGRGYQYSCAEGNKFRPDYGHHKVIAIAGTNRNVCACSPAEYCHIDGFPLCSAENGLICHGELNECKHQSVCAISNGTEANVNNCTCASAICDLTTGLFCNAHLNMCSHFRLNVCPFSTASNGSFYVATPGCQLSRMITLSAGDIMNVSGNASADPLNELRAMGGMPTASEPKRHFFVNGTDTELRVSYLRLTGGRVHFGAWDGDPEGGSIKVSHGATLHISLCAFLGCGVGYCARTGGAVHIGTESNGVFIKSTFDGNSAERYGGALTVNRGGHAVIVSCTFANNMADHHVYGAMISVFDNDEWSKTGKMTTLLLSGGGNQFIGSAGASNQYIYKIGSPSKDHGKQKVVFDMCPPGAFQPVNIAENATWSSGNSSFIGCPGQCPEGWTTPGHNYALNKYADANAACSVPCPANQSCVSCPKGRSNDGSELTSEAQCISLDVKSVDVRMVGRESLKFMIASTKLDGGNNAGPTDYLASIPAVVVLRDCVDIQEKYPENSNLTSGVYEINPPPIMISRGPGGCGGSPYIWEMTDDMVSCAQRCLEDEACIKVQRSYSGNCYASGVFSNLQPAEPNGNSDWSCAFKLHGSFDVWCDFDTENGPYTVFQRRRNGFESFDEKLWKEYKEGFGSVANEFWLGNDHIHRLTMWTEMSLRIDMCKTSLQDCSHAQYGSFSIGNEADNYRLELGGEFDSSDNLTDAMRGDTVSHHRSQFSTTDRDNEKSIQNCAQKYQGGWWYDGNPFCHAANLNGKYGDDRPSQGLIWSTTSSLEYVQMGVTRHANVTARAEPHLQCCNMCEWRENRAPRSNYGSSYCNGAFYCNLLGCSCSSIEQRLASSCACDFSCHTNAGGSASISLRKRFQTLAANIEKSSVTIHNLGNYSLKASGISPITIHSCNLIGCSVNSVTVSIDVPDPPHVVEAQVIGVDKLQVMIVPPLYDGGANVSQFKVFFYALGSPSHPLKMGGPYTNGYVKCPETPGCTSINHGAKTINMCKALCLAQTSCKSIDWNQTDCKTKTKNMVDAKNAGAWYEGVTGQFPDGHWDFIGERLTYGPYSIFVEHADSLSTSVLDIQNSHNTYYRIEAYSCSYAGCSETATKSTNIPPCVAPNSENISGICWAFQCPSGKYQSSLTECTNMTINTCPPGQNFNSASAVYQEGRKGSTEDDGACSLCTRGRYKTTISPTRCLACPLGYYTNHTASTSCSACPPGAFAKTEGTATCALCRAGTYSSEIASASSSTCITCGTGTYSDKNGSANCTDCPAGTKLLESEADGSEYHDDLKDCENCPVLQFNPFPGNFECYSCLSAKLPGAISCDGCFPGKYKVTRVHSDGNRTDDCIECPSGYYTSQQNRKKCDACPRGYFANNLPSIDNTIRFDRCQSCPRGRHGMRKAAHNETDGCNDCPVGRFTENEHRRSENECDGCPPGRWSNATGLAKESLCNNCDAGKYGSIEEAAAASTSCIDCSTGKYSKKVGAYGESSTCLDCPSGFAPLRFNLEILLQEGK